MRILIVKTSSLGDVIHNLPVISDIRRHHPGAQIDWCVEEGFADIPHLHSGVGRVIPVAIRRWRKQLFARSTWGELAACRATLRKAPYDLIIDTQGLVKSALITRWAQGVKAGYAADSAREPLAARFYDRRYHVDRAQHAVPRNRQLAAAALGYVADGLPDYGLAGQPASFSWLPGGRYVVALSATSRDDKLWPEANWLRLGALLAARDVRLVFPGGSARELARAARLAAGVPGAVAAPSMKIPDLAALLAGAAGAVGVDTGLTHLAVALGVPTVALYTATDPGLTGVLGAGFHRNLGGKACVPPPEDVLAELVQGLR